MKPKRLFSALLVMGISFGITACGGNTSSIADKPSNTEASVTESTKDSKPETTTTKAPETTTTKVPETTTTKAPETTTTKVPETTTSKAPETITSIASETQPPVSDTSNMVKLTNISTGEIFELYNDTAIYTQADGWASFALGGHDVEGEEGCSIIAEVILDGATCDSQNSYTIYDSYKPPSFLVHLGTVNGPVTIDDANYPNNFGDCLIYIDYIEPLKNVAFSLDVMFVGGDGNTYRISGKGNTAFTIGSEPPERIYDETCIVCNGTGFCPGCDGSGWFSTAGNGVRCTSCYGYSGICIGCDGHGKH